MTQRIAMIGDELSVAPFEALGVDTFPLASLADAQQVFETTVRADFAVVFVTEEVYEHVQDEVAEAALQSLPAVSIVPSVLSARGMGNRQIEAAIERALGTKVPISDDDNDDTSDDNDDGVEE